MPVLNASLQDRSGFFSAGEYDLLQAASACFGGWENLDTNIRPTGTARCCGRSTTTRHFGGDAPPAGRRARSLAVRVEERRSASRSHPSSFGSDRRRSSRSTSDTGSTDGGAADQRWAGSPRSAATRAAKTSTPLHVRDLHAARQRRAAVRQPVPRRRSCSVSRPDGQPLATGSTATRTCRSAPARSSNCSERGTWVRLEGSTSRNHDMTTGDPRGAAKRLSVGLNGQIARNTTIGLNVYADRAPVGFPGDRAGVADAIDPARGPLDPDRVGARRQQPTAATRAGARHGHR